jgi:hypothetical protein
VEQVAPRPAEALDGEADHIKGGDGDAHVGHHLGADVRDVLGADGAALEQLKARLHEEDQGEADGPPADGHDRGEPRELVLRHGGGDGDEECVHVKTLFGRDFRRVSRADRDR